MADALDSKSSGGKPRVGSSPTSGITIKPDRNGLKTIPVGFFCNSSYLSARNQLPPKETQRAQYDGTPRSNISSPP